MIKAARKIKGLTQSNLASKLNISQCYVSNLENANAPGASISLIIDLSNILDLSPVDVFIFLISSHPNCRKK
ncbi:MAG: helix-turn-helix transcriptional regulator [Clostridium sp.]